MAIFQFFNYHSRRLTTAEYEINSPQELEEIISRQFHDKILAVRLLYYGIDRNKMKDSYTVQVKFLRNGSKFYKSVGRIDECFAEIEA